jgi:cytochrome c oxidase subunit II
MERYERVFLTISAVVLVTFLGALAFSVFAMGISMPGRAQMIACSTDQRLRRILRVTPPFNSLGVHQTGAGKFDVVVVAQTWSFTPDEIDLPAHAEVTFRATSSDVIHGFMIVGTNVNMMLIPGEVTTETYTFSRPGEYLLLCHEYCGRLHHTMSGRVVVK